MDSEFGRRSRDSEKTGEVRSSGGCGGVSGMRSRSKGNTKGGSNKIGRKQG